jgi:CRISPR/Cas system-associated exonuclease Cas4 (RecB family)
MVKHEPIDLGYKDLIVEEGLTRFYQNPNNPSKKYPSITSVLSILSKEPIEEWRLKVGPEEAKKISFQSANRGTKVHLMVERYLDNNPGYANGFLPNIRNDFRRLKPLLDNIDKVILQEAPLYSDILGIAGRVDCIGYYKGVLSVIDFKTSRKPKKKEWIESYFMQAAFYAAAFYERTGIAIKQAVILISVDGSESQEFIVPAFQWIPKLMGVKKLYDEQ